MELIKQKVNYLNGVPMHKAGEWPGKLPSHWRGSIRILKPIQEKNQNENIGKKQFEPRVYPDIIPQLKLRKGTNNNIREKITGLRRIEPHFTEPIIHQKNILSHLITIKEECPRGQKHFLIPSNNNEFYLKDVIGSKKRLTSLEAIRNGISAVSPGDKIYKSVEYSPGFFKMEGIIVGSTNKIYLNKNYGIRSDNFYSSINLNEKTLDNSKIWKNKQIKETLEKDCNYVNSLNTWEKSNVSSTTLDKEKNKIIQNKNINIRKK